MSGIKYEVLTGDDLISALRGGRTGDLLDDAAYAAADEIERLRERVRDLEESVAGMVVAEWHNEVVERLHRELEFSAINASTQNARIAGLERELAEARFDQAQASEAMLRYAHESALYREARALLREARVAAGRRYLGNNLTRRIDAFLAGDQSPG